MSVDYAVFVGLDVGKGEHTIASTKESVSPGQVVMSSIHRGRRRLAVADQRFGQLGAGVGRHHGRSYKVTGYRF
ncbi:hypothetical protein [Microtetraspora malaysiensis]|uniref:hypothetical protein n=1 Tax=Microtetraspora malaysiensis TaxID=161358 RepID=UPI003D8BF741